MYFVDFLKEPAPGFVDNLYSSFCFFLVDLSLELDYFWQSTPLGSRAFRCAVKLLVYSLSSFFLEAVRAKSFPFNEHCFQFVP